MTLSVRLKFNMRPDDATRNPDRGDPTASITVVCSCVEGLIVALRAHPSARSDRHKRAGRSLATRRATSAVSAVVRKAQIAAGRRGQRPCLAHHAARLDELTWRADGRGDSVDRVQLTGRGLSLTANATAARTEAQELKAHVDLSLPDLTRVSPALAGTLKLHDREPHRQRTAARP